jgi:hypothetical protein
VRVKGAGVPTTHMEIDDVPQADGTGGEAMSEGDSEERKQGADLKPSPETAVKRGRGRPPKKHSAEKPPATGSDQPKRPRGRPPGECPPLH